MVAFFYFTKQLFILRYKTIGTKPRKFNLYNKDLFFYWLLKAI